MNLDLLLVRHAETDCSRREVFCGACDTRLTCQGLRMAGRLADALGDGRFGAPDSVVSSPAVRCVQTARTICARLALPLRRDSRWAEMRFGRWEGLSISQTAQIDHRDHAAWTSDPVTVPPPGGESGATALARAVGGLRPLVEAHPNGRVVVVSHKHVIRLLLAHAGDVPLRTYRRISAPPGSLSVLRLNEYGLRLISGARTV
jgi:broad specificity phosphatase PhoE